LETRTVTFVAYERQKNKGGEEMSKKRKIKLYKPVSNFPSRNWKQTVTNVKSVGKDIAQTSTHTVRSIRDTYPRVGMYGVRKSVGLPKARRA